MNLYIRNVLCYVEVSTVCSSGLRAYQGRQSRLTCQRRLLHGVPHFYAKNLYSLTIGYVHYIARSVPRAHRQCARFRNIQGCASCLLVTGYGVSDCSHVLLRSYQDGDIIGVRDHRGLPLREFPVGFRPDSITKG